ncbi:MAG: ATP-dependent Clp protease proteolytic subunit [Gemmatimonadaceae bacterium]|nr:ATP-dependent Clp protease proteolytic subunit [Gemmatimonadaceae bacterium]
MPPKKESSERRGLDEHGIIFLSGGIDGGKAESICEKIIEFNVGHEVDLIQLMINSGGGECAAGFGVIDLMDWSRLPVYTTGVGMVASMALAVFMAGEPGHRVLTPRTSVLSHRFSALSFGNHSELVARRKEEDLLHRRLVDHYLAFSNLTSEEEVTERLLSNVDTWLTPEEAVEVGIADKVQQDRPARRSGVEVRR